MIKSPLRYPGGKSRAVDTIMKMIPDFDEFREPFLGGGSVFVHVRQRYPDRRYWINDLYPELYGFSRDVSPKAVSGA
jgi:DNA adenine methylase